MGKQEKSDHDYIEDDMEYYRRGPMINLPREDVAAWSKRSRETTPFGQNINVSRIRLDTTLLRPKDPNVFKNYILNLRDLWVQGILGETNLVHKFVNLARLWVMGYLPIAMIYTIGLLIPQWALSVYCGENLYWRELNDIVYAPMYGALALCVTILSPLFGPLYTAIGENSVGIRVDDVTDSATLLAISLICGYCIYWFGVRLYKHITRRHPQWRHIYPTDSCTYYTRLSQKQEEAREQDMIRKYQREVNAILERRAQRRKGI